MNQQEFFKLVETSVETFVQAGGKLTSGQLIDHRGQRCAVGCLAQPGDLTVMIAVRFHLDNQVGIYDLEYGFDDAFDSSYDGPSPNYEDNEWYSFGYKLGVKYRSAR